MTISDAGMRHAVDRAAVASEPRLLEGFWRHLFERQPEEIAVCPETLEGPREVRLGGDAWARQVATMPRSTHARCAPPVLPAKSMLRRSLATSFEAPNPYDGSFTAPGAGAAAFEMPPTAASAAIDVVFAEFAPTGDDVLYFSAVVCGR